MLTQIAKAKAPPRPAVDPLAHRAVAEKVMRLLGPRCRRILLINPLPFAVGHFSATQAKNRRYYAWPPYGIGVLCRMLRSRGYEVKLVDHNYDLLSFAHREPDPQVIEAQVDALWRSKTDEAIAQFQPDLVGLTCMFTMTHPMMVEVARHVKATCPTLPIIAGGVHVSNAPEFVLQAAPAIDFASLFEGDVSFGDMLDVAAGKLEAGSLAQIATLIDGQYAAISERAQPREDQINFPPDYDELPIGEYSQLGELGSYRSWLPPDTRATSSISNRGCRAHCSFCSVANFNGKGVRQREIDAVVDEIAMLKAKYGINHIAWLDDDLFYNRERTMALFTAMIERNLGVTWCASNGVIASAAAAAPEVLEAAAKAGCIGMTFGVESGSEKILREVHKPSGVRHSQKAGELMLSHPEVFTRGFLIIGFPNETLGQIEETIDLAYRMQLDWYGIQLLSPLPNTEIYKTMVDLGIVTDVEFKKNSEKDGSTLYVVRQGEKQRRIEESGKHDAGQFSNPFALQGKETVPTREELQDLWLLVDYRINYQPILTQQSPAKLLKKQRILQDICSRMTRGNPLANLFLGIVERKLGNVDAAAHHYALAVDYLNASAYWRLRFDVLELNDLEEVGWHFVRARATERGEHIDENLRNSGYTV